MARATGPRDAVVACGFAVAAVASIAACRGSTPANDLTDAGESPQAKAEPAPLANALVTASASPLAPDAGPPPVPLRADQPAPPDLIAKDATGWEMEAALRPADPPPAFRGPETSIVAIDAAKKRTEPHLLIDFTPNRARIVFASGAFVLPPDTELRARADRYGHFLLLPNAPQYRVAAPGSLRALFDDRRLDVGPLAVAEVTGRGEGPKRLGYRTRRVEVTNRAGSATFEIARVAEAGEGGELVCRALLDLMNAPPSTPACGVDDVPLHVEWRWARSAKDFALAFDVVSFARRVDLTAQVLAAPPSSATFVLPALPSLRAEATLPASEVGLFRTAPADVLPASTGDAAPPAAGLELTNASDQLRFAWLDGAPIAWVAPGGHLLVPTLLRGRYGFAWRSFLADAVDPPITITVPTLVNAGAGDGGAP